MPKDVLSNRKKLIPLRRLAKPEVYSTAYLSQLVQRKKLKAEKIGRNYFTTEEWFEEYLRRYAQDDKVAAYKAVLDNNSNEQPESGAINKEKKEDNRIIGFIYKAIAIVAIVFVFVNILFNFLNKKIISIDSGRGQVAGADEARGDYGGTSTVEK